MYYERLREKEMVAHREKEMCALRKKEKCALRDQKMRAMSLSDCRFIEMPKISDVRGNLTYIESGNQIPFDIERVYYIYDVPGGSERGSHAHRSLHQFIVAMSGSFDVVLHDGKAEQRFHLNRSYSGLYVCPMMWRTLDNFSSGSVCMVLASERYTEDDYIRDWDTFVDLTK